MEDIDPKKLVYIAQSIKQHQLLQNLRFLQMTLSDSEVS